MESQQGQRNRQRGAVSRLLLWYGTLIGGGLIILSRMATWLIRELAAVLTRRSEHRIYGHISPARSIPSLAFSMVVGLFLYLLNITLVLPLFMAIVYSSSLIGRRRKSSVDVVTQDTREDGNPVGRNRHYYDGAMYTVTIDPLEAELKQAICGYITPGTEVIDICCGPGTISFELARLCRKVVGIDHALGMIQYADEQRKSRHIENVHFVHADAAHLSEYETGAFDYAVISMAIHEMPGEMRIRALKEASRVAKHVIIADYAVPLPVNTSGLMFRYLEVIAGLNHFEGFLRYSKHGGLEPLLNKSGLKIEQETSALQGTVRVVKASPNSTSRLENSLRRRR